MRRVFLLFIVLFITLLIPSSMMAAVDKPVLRVGWYLLDPFQYSEKQKGQDILTGLDIEMIRAIAGRTGHSIEFVEGTWQGHLDALQRGDLDMVGTAFNTEKRRDYAHFSFPYRQETNAIYVLRGDSRFSDSITISDYLTIFNQPSFKLGVVKGYIYTDDQLNSFISDAAYNERIITADNDYQNLQHLLSGQVDAFVADRIVAATIAWRLGLQDELESYPITSKKDLHLMFSKKTVPRYVVDSFNASIQSARSDGTFNRITEDYIFPILLSQTIDSKWFFVIDIVGTFVFALSGLLLAYQYRYDIFGAFVLAALPAVGGGVLRDLITNRDPIGLLQSPVYLLVILLTVILGYIVIKFFAMHGTSLHKSSIYKSMTLRRIINHAILVSDALGLAAFTVTGVVVALGTNSDPLWLWGPCLAVLTAAGGGILRDVLRSEPDIASLKGEFYPEIAFIWGLFLSFYLTWQSQKIEPDEIFIGIIITIVGAFGTRMAAIRYNVKSPGYY